MKKLFLTMLCLIVIAFSVFAEEVPEKQTDTKDLISSIVQKQLSITDSTDVLKENYSADAYNITCKRLNGFSQMESRIGAIFDQITINVDINSCDLIDEENATVKAFLTNVIDYHYADIEDSDDFFAYGTEHVLSLRFTDNRWLITEDSFDEFAISGFLEEDFSELEYDTNTDSSIMVAGTTHFTQAQVEATILYANQYCGFSTATRRFNGDSQLTTGSNQSSTYYNSSYISYPGDCANFVSQCIHAGGLATNSTWQPEDEENGIDAQIAWVEAEGLSVYLGNLFGTGSVTSSYSNVYPGNPVYWLNEDFDNTEITGTGHQMICVGKNAAGVPVLNGHTNNMYRFPISNYTITLHDEDGMPYACSAPLKTIYVAAANRHSIHTFTYYSSVSLHSRMCSVCDYHYVIEAHVLNASATRCTVCGYAGPFLAE